MTTATRVMGPSRRRPAVSRWALVVASVGLLVACTRSPAVSTNGAAPAFGTTPTTTTAPTPTTSTIATTTTTTQFQIDPSYFVPGSCVTFAPTVGNRHTTVYLDAGHGGLDPGAVGTTESGQPVHEADQTLAVELDTMALLRAEGFQVTVSRTEDSTVVRLQPGDTSGPLLTESGDHRDLLARELCPDLAHADLLVGIYFNGSGSPLSAGCITGYDAARPFAAANLRLATLLQHDVLGLMNAQGWAIPDLGVASDTALGGSAPTPAAAAYDRLILLGPADPGYVPIPSEMPGALIEPLYVTDPFEANIAVSTSGQQLLAMGIATAVDEYFGPSKG